MAHIFADNVREGSVTEGTGDFVTSGGITSPGGVIVGRRLADVLTESDTFDYTIFHTTINEWEIGVGTYIGPNTFSRNPSSSSNGGSLVSFSPGSKQVFIAPVAARMMDEVSDDRLPHVQSGKTFTSTVTVTGESGIRVLYDDQSYSFGTPTGGTPDFQNSIRTMNNFSTWFIDVDDIPLGFRVRFHNSGDNYEDFFRVSPDGSAIVGHLVITEDSAGSIGNNNITTVSGAGSPDAINFPLGHTIVVIRDDALNRNAPRTVRLSTSNTEEYVTTGSGDILTGTWRSRGRYSGFHLMERMA